MDFVGTGAPNNLKAHPIVVKDGVGFVTDEKVTDVDRVDVK